MQSKQHKDNYTKMCTRISPYCQDCCVHIREALIHAGKQWLPLRLHVPAALSKTVVTFDVAVDEICSQPCAGQCFAALGNYG